MPGTLRNRLSKSSTACGNSRLALRWRPRPQQTARRGCARTILGNVGIIGCLQISAEEASVFVRELQLHETLHDRRGSDVAEIEAAIGRERRRLAELGAPSSHLLDSLQSELLRARKAELCKSIASQSTHCGRICSKIWSGGSSFSPGFPTGMAPCCYRCLRSPLGSRKRVPEPLRS